MLAGLMNFLKACFRPNADRHVHAGLDSGGRQDGLLWYKDFGQHCNGEFCMAVLQANNLLENQSQLESGCLSMNDSGPYGTFVRIYDGHGGPETSRFINDRLFQHVKSVFPSPTSVHVCVLTSNLGDSRSVLGRLVKATGELLAIQLSAERNASIESVRQELKFQHPEDSKIVVLKHN